MHLDGSDNDVDRKVLLRWLERLRVTTVATAVECYKTTKRESLKGWKTGGTKALYPPFETA